MSRAAGSPRSRSRPPTWARARAARSPRTTCARPPDGNWPNRGGPRRASPPGMIAMGGSSRAAEAESGRLYEVSRPDGADERAARRAASGAFGPGHLHAAGPTDQVRVPPVVDQVLASGGTPLDAATRGVMEPRLGHNLAGVRIHAGPDAALAARSIQARAFTAGSHVVLGSSVPAAGSPAGARLLAHELT